METLKTIAALVAVNFFFGSGIPILKEVLGHIDPVGWILIRSLSAALILCVWQYRQLHLLTFRLLVWLFVASILGVMINQICFAEGLARTTAAHAGMINATVPLFTLLFGWLFLQEKLNLRKVSGILLGFAGVLFLLRVDSLGSFNPFLRGDIFIWINVISYSLFLIVSRNFITRMIQPMVGIFWMSLIGSVGIGWYGDWHLPLGNILASPFQIQMFMLYLIIFPGIISYSLNLWALKRVESSQAALYVYIQPLVATILAYGMTGAIPDHRFWLSSVLIVAGILLSSLK